MLLSLCMYILCDGYTLYMYNYHLIIVYMFSVHVQYTTIHK